MSRFTLDAGQSPAADVVKELSLKLPASERLMLIGAEARDIIHHLRGHAFSYVASSDVDIVVALGDWTQYTTLTADYTRLGDTQYRFRVSDYPVDIIPFGGIEEPAGRLTHPQRSDEFDVFGMSAVYAAADELSFGDSVECLLPTAQGYAALKLKAWIDRSDWGEYKDGIDIGLAMFWYLSDDTLGEALWESDAAIVEEYGYDIDLACARKLGMHVAETLGQQDAEALRELLDEPSRELLARYLVPRDITELRRLGDTPRRIALLRALRNGL